MGAGPFNICEIRNTGEKEKDKETKEFENRLDGCITTVNAAINGCGFIVLALILIAAAVMVFLH